RAGGAAGVPWTAERCRGRSSDGHGRCLADHPRRAKRTGAGAASRGRRGAGPNAQDRTLLALGARRLPRAEALDEAVLVPQLETCAVGAGARFLPGVVV